MLCPSAQRNRFPLLERHAGDVLGLDEISADDCYDCQCLACRAIGYIGEFEKGITLKCRVGDCTYTTKDRTKYRGHEKGHYKKPNHKNSFCCLENGCTYSNARWGSLHIHTRQMHCNNAKGFYCPVTWCKFSESGFYRKERWLEHMHRSHSEMALTELESAWEALITKQQDANTTPPPTERCETPLSPHATECCTCMACEEVGAPFEDDGATEKACRFKGCNDIKMTKDLVKHEKAHFKGSTTMFYCTETNCNYSSLRFGDLRRHYKAHHCIAPPLKCPEPGCSFTTSRKDKLISHQRLKTARTHKRDASLSS